MTNSAFDDRIAVNHALYLAHPAAVMAFSRTERSIELARLIYLAGEAVANFGNFAWTAFKDARKYHRMVNELDGLSDRMLKDIGVQRGEISSVVRSAMAEAKQYAEAPAPVYQTIVNTPVVAPAANANELKKHDLAA